MKGGGDREVGKATEKKRTLNPPEADCKQRTLIGKRQSGKHGKIASTASSWFIAGRDK